MEQRPRRSAASATKQARIDWEAVERDYRTGKFTLRELAEKHGCTHQAIDKRAKKHAWTKDLNDVIRQATDAALVAEMVASSGQAVANTVIAVAEMNKQIIIGQRKRIAQLQEDAAVAKEKLIALADTVADIREAGVLVSAMEGLSRISKTLTEQERLIYKLDDDSSTTTTQKRVVVEFRGAE